MKSDCKLLRALWLTGATLMMLDGLTTYLALSHVEGAREANPLGVWAVEHLGLAGMCIAKGIIGILCVWRLVRRADRGAKFSWASRDWRLRRVPEYVVMRGARRAMWFTAVLMAVVVFNNSFAIWRHA